MKSKIFSNRYVKTELKSQPWIPIFIIIGFMIAFPVTELIYLGRWESSGYTLHQMRILYENLWRDGFVATGMLMTAVAALINGINGFWYLYSGKKIDFYHSLPLNRCQIFCQKFFTGIIFYIFSYIAMAFLTICLGASKSFFSIGLMGSALEMLVFHLLWYALFYFCIVLILCMTGNVLMGILSMGGLLLYGPLLGYLLNGYCIVFYQNYRESYSGIIGAITKYLSPASAAVNFLSQYKKGDNDLLLFAWLFAVAVFVSIAAFFAFEKRQVENVGKALIYRWSEPVIRLMLVIATGLGMGIIIYEMEVGQNRVVWTIAGSVFGMLLIHGLLETFYHFDFRRFFAKKIQFLLSVAIVAFVAFVFGKDLTGYDSYVPSYNRIESVSIDCGELSQYEFYSRIQKGKDGKYIDGGTVGYGNINFQKVKIDEKLYQVLKKIGGEKEQGGIIYNVPVKYHTKSGKDIYRNYRVNSSASRELMELVYRDKGYIDEKYSFLKIDRKYLEYMNLSGEQYDGIAIRETKEFLENLKKDVEEADEKIMMEKPCLTLQYAYEKIPTVEDPDRMIPGENAEFYSGGSVYLYPGFKRTMEFLEKKGYTVSSVREPIKYIDVYYEKEDKENNSVKSIGIRYDDKEQVEQLQSAIMFETLVPSWIEVEESSVYVMQEGREERKYVKLLKESTPDFILEDEKKAKEGYLESNIQ